MSLNIVAICISYVHSLFSLPFFFSCFRYFIPVDLVFVFILSKKKVLSPYTDDIQACVCTQGDLEIYVDPIHQNNKKTQHIKIIK